MRSRTSIKYQISKARVAAAQARLDRTPPDPKKYWLATAYPSDPNDLNWRDPECYNETRLHKAAASGDLQVVLRLLRDGACPFVFDDQSHTPYRLACLYGHQSVEKVLKKAMDRRLRDWHSFKMESDRHYRFRHKHRRPVRTMFDVYCRPGNKSQPLETE